MLTFGQLKASRLPGVLGLCPEDARLAGIVNEAQQRLLTAGMWWGTYQRLVVEGDASGVVTWPREVAHVENAAWAGTPIPVRNQWYEFLGPVWPFGEGGEIGLEDFGVACATSDLSGLPGRRIRLDRGEVSDAARRVLLQGYDENGAWITGDDGAGTYHDGEWVVLDAASKVTVNTFSRLVAVQKEETHGTVRAYEWDGAAGRRIAEWRGSETAPQYRRSRIRPFGGRPTQVVALVKLDHLPVSRDTDWLALQNLPALKEACRAVLKREHSAYDEADAHEREALRLLRNELRHHTGDRVEVSLRCPGSGLRRTFANVQ